ncbi:MAG: glycosyltransferase family 39 protein [Bacteroidota bacterium]|nr:glycosyltransferase family 39 protein [Bacteroidota bacterium]
MKSNVIILFLVLNLIFKIIFIAGPFEHFDAAAFPDDTYISLYLAKNIADGNGPLYTTGYTNGFQPMYVFLCVPFYLIFDEDKIKPVYAALIMLMIFDCLSLIMILNIVNLFTQNKYSLTISALFWITSPYIVLTSMNGLETIISFFFIVSSFYYFFKKRNNFINEKGYKNLIILGILCGLAVFSRIDNGILALVILLFIITDRIKNKNDYRQIVKSGLIYSCFVILTILPWLIYSFVYTGEIIQSSGEAVRYQNWSLKNYFQVFSGEQVELIVYGFRIALIKNLPLILGCVTCVIILLYKKKKVNFSFLKGKLVDLLPLILFCALLFCSYVFYVYGMWFFKRYFFPFVFLFIMLLSLLTDSALKSFENSSSRKKFMIIISAMLLIINFTRYDFIELYINKNNKTDLGYRAIGEWVSKNFKAGTIIGAMQSGAIAYFSDSIKVINLDGVVNKDALISIKNKDLMGYVKKMNIDYIVGWNINNEYLVRESLNFNNKDLTKVLTINGFETWSREWSVYKVNYIK